MFDSAQTNTARSRTWCCITLRAVLYCMESHFSRISLRKRIFQRNHLDCLSGTQTGLLRKKNTKKYRDTASLSKVVFHGDFKMSSVLYSIVRGRRMVKSKQVCSPFAEIYTGQFKNVALKERLSQQCCLPSMCFFQCSYYLSHIYSFCQ